MSESVNISMRLLSQKVRRQLVSGKIPRLSSQAEVWKSLKSQPEIINAQTGATHLAEHELNQPSGRQRATSLESSRKRMEAHGIQTRKIPNLLALRVRLPNPSSQLEGFNPRKVNPNRHRLNGNARRERSHRSADNHTQKQRPRHRPTWMYFNPISTDSVSKNFFAPVMSDSQFD
jgi:hypothetical protein